MQKQSFIVFKITVVGRKKKKLLKGKINNT